MLLNDIGFDSNFVGVGKGIGQHGNLLFLNAVFAFGVEEHPNETLPTGRYGFFGKIGNSTTAGAAGVLDKQITATTIHEAKRIGHLLAGLDIPKIMHLFVEFHKRHILLIQLAIGTYRKIHIITG